ncbi:MAG: TetR/AcrR family transcriptional regulator [Tistlia sp.]|uniref:TetR/AcrR family transcriptional regulator n=1 Tax=Tistlia sp. TaxID=3057121 RepID=UPI0034A4933E
MPDAPEEPAAQRAAQRDPQRARRDILRAARAEFAAYGLGGARVDRIAAQAGLNKRMLYYYFRSKEGLFTAVLEAVYDELCALAESLEVEAGPPLERLEHFVELVFDHYARHPDSITLLNSENLHGARHLATSPRLKELSPGFRKQLARLIARGEADGSFRRGIDPVDLYLSIVGQIYFVQSNAATLSLFFGRDMTRPRVRQEWRRHVRQMILAGVRAPERAPERPPERTGR